MSNYRITSNNFSVILIKLVTSFDTQRYFMIPYLT